MVPVYGETAAMFTSQVSALPPVVQAQMRLYSWHPGCPVGLNQLAYVQLSYWGFDQQVHQGVLIVNQQVAAEVVNIFRQLFQIHFPIAKMQPIDVYQGDDNKAMADNNTSAFNCRPITGTIDKFSLHSYGTAIDINPLINPYVKGDLVLPEQGRQYLERNSAQPGIITQSNKIYQIFTAQGWQWGGDWHSLKDYQHFEKTLHE